MVYLIWMKILRRRPKNKSKQKKKKLKRNIKNNNIAVFLKTIESILNLNKVNLEVQSVRFLAMLTQEKLHYQTKLEKQMCKKDKLEVLHNKSEQHFFLNKN